jgi:uncharacterized Tic20 family protein
MSSSDDTRNWSMVAHFAGAAAQMFMPSFGFVGPLVVLMLRQQDPVVQYHAKQAAVFQLAMAAAIWVIGAVATALTCFVIGVFIYPLAVIPWIAGLALPIWAGIQVSNGERFDYPMIGSFITKPPELE